MTKNDINLISQGISGVKTSVIQIWTYYIESSALQHVQYMCICNAYAYTTPSIGKELHFFNSLTSMHMCMYAGFYMLYPQYTQRYILQTHERPQSSQKYLYNCQQPNHFAFYPCVQNIMSMVTAKPSATFSRPLALAGISDESCTCKRLSLAESHAWL